MTISTNDLREEYTATASQTVFSFDFRVFADTDVTVYQTASGSAFNDASDIITAYSVSRNANQDSSPGGSITLNTGATVGDRITIVSAIPESRTTDYQVGGAFDPDTVDDDMDRILSVAKQASAKAGRAMLAPASEQNAGDLALPDSSARSDKLLGFNSSGDPEAVAYTQSTVTSTDVRNLLGDNVRTFSLSYTSGSGGITSSSVNTTFDTTFVAGDVIETTHFDSDKNRGSGAKWQFTGTTTLANAGTVNSDGYVYDSVGRQFFYVGSPVNVLAFGSVGDGVTDDYAAINKAYAALLSGTTLDRGEVLFPMGAEGVYLHSDTIVVDKSYTALIFQEGVILKAGAAMTYQVQMGDGVNRKEDIQIFGGWFKGDNLADYAIADLGTRISGIKGCCFEDHLEYHIHQAPTTADFSEFMTIRDNQGYDAKGFFLSEATATGRSTDLRMYDNVMFRPTLWFAVWDTCQRFTAIGNVVASQTNDFTGGIHITASDTNATSTVTFEHIIDNFYHESNSTYGADMEAVRITNTSTNKTIQGCAVRDIMVQPATLVEVCHIYTPTTANTIRSTEISGADAKSGFANSIVIESSVNWTRIYADNYESGADAYISNSGSNTVINGITQGASGKGTAPASTSLAVGDFYRNTSNDSLWTKAEDGTVFQVGAGLIVYSETRNLPSIAAGANLIISVSVTGVTLGDYAQVAFEVSQAGLIINGYCRTGLVDISIFNPTGGAIDLASTTMRILVTKH